MVPCMCAKNWPLPSTASFSLDFLGFKPVVFASTMYFTVQASSLLFIHLEEPIALWNSVSKGTHNKTKASKQNCKWHQCELSVPERKQSSFSFLFSLKPSYNYVMDQPPLVASSKFYHKTMLRCVGSSPLCRGMWYGSGIGISWLNRKLRYT